MSEPYKTFGLRLHDLRQALGLTQEEVGNRCNLTGAAISHFEADRRDPSLKNIRKICKGLGCNPNMLIDVY